jgi:DNA-directed RNA polymerase subunit L
MENINKTDRPLRKYLLDQQQVTTYAIKHPKNTGTPLDSTLRTEVEGDTCGNARTALQETLKSMVGQKMDRSFTDMAYVQ